MATPFIMVAPNGARRGKTDHPALPVTLQDTVDTARSCHAAGADALHLHIRDAQGGHSLDPGAYAEALAELAQVVPTMRIQITTEAAGVYDVPAQLECLTRLQPGWASISVREIARAPDLAPRVYGVCADQGTQVQHILYDTGDIAILREWQAQGIVPEGPVSVLYVLGRYAAGQVSTPEDLAPFRAAMPESDDWMVCAFGPAEHDCLIHAAGQGGQLRVGFENSLTNSAGQPHPDNAASVAALVAALQKVPS